MSHTILVFLTLMSLTEQFLIKPQRPRSEEEADCDDQCTSESESESESESKSEECNTIRRRPEPKRVEPIVLEHQTSPPTTTTKRPVVCKWQYSVHHDKVNWYTAKDRCYESGRLLVTIENADVFDEVKRAIQNNGGPGEFWTAGSDQGEEGKWMWVTTGVPMTFTEWHHDSRYDEPNNTGPWGSEDCLQIYPTNDFNDRDCENVKLKYICQEKVCE